MRIWASVTTVDLGRLVEVAQGLEEIGVDGVHVDLSDGVFIPDLIFGARVVAALTSRITIPVEAHLMVTTPEVQARAVADAGAARIAFHLESTPYPWRLVNLIRDLGPQVGVALNPVTVLDPLAYLAGAVDLVTVLTSEPDGWGDKYLTSSPARVARVRALMGTDCMVQVDGGVHADVVAALQDAGADECVVGRALVDDPDPARALRELRSIAGHTPHETIPTPRS